MAPLANLTLQRRIGLLVLAGLAIGLSLFSWLGVQSVNDSVDRTLDERLTTVRMMADHLDKTLNYILVQLEYATNHHGGLTSKEQFNQMAQSLRETLDKLGIVTRNVILVDRDSKVLQIEPDDPGSIGTYMVDHPTVQETLRTGVATISGLVSSPLLPMPTAFLNTPVVPVVLINTPVMNPDGEIIGVLINSIDVTQSHIGAFEQTVSVGKTGYTEIVDGSGTVITRTRPGSPLKTFEKSDHPDRFAELIAQGKATVGTCHRCHETEESVERRRDVLAFAPLATTSWGVVIRQSEEEALAPTSELRQRLLLSGVVVIVSTFLLVWLAMQGIVRPIRALTAAAKKVAAGDFQAAIPAQRKDEIGQLNTAFYTMTQELAKSRDELVLRNRELRTYAAYVIHAQEDERQRIARELHDVTIQALALVCRRLDSAQNSAGSLPPALINNLKEARETAEEVVRELRDFTKALRPPVLDDLGMATSIRRLLADLKERHKIKGQLKVAGKERRLPPDIEIDLFRIAQEALRNAERHAEATNVNVTITFRDDETILEIVDNGKGFSKAAVAARFTTSGQLGLISMQERAEALGGKLEINSSPGKGTRITASIPTSGGTPKAPAHHLDA